jgi:ribose 5-phosphate isomerase B
MKIAIGSDHAGFELKQNIIQYLKSKHEIKDFGTFNKESCDFPDFAKKVCESVSKGDYERGILICTNGGGMTVASNKFKNIIATNIYSPHEESLDVIKHDREHINSNVLCFGAKFLGIDFAKKIIGIWLATNFKGNEPGGERFNRRLNKIKEIEGQIMWKGVIIKESLENEKLLNKIKIVRTRVTGLEMQGGKYQFLYFELKDENLEDFIEEAKNTIKNKWYTHICKGNEMIVIFSGKIFRFKHNENLKIEEARKYGLSIGIIKEQMPFEEIIKNPYH